jgi:hypothetical protein
MKGDDEAFEEIVRGIRSGDPAIKEPVSRELQRLTLPRRTPEAAPEPGKDWYVIRVELISGRADDFEPPPGRDILISRQHTFRQFAEAINSAFARWDLGHLYMFRLADGTAIGIALEELPHREAARTKIGKRQEGEVFEYEFDFGDGWLHRCTILESEVDPADVYGVRPKGPVAVWGWGSIPDQYGRTTPDG